MRGLKIRANGAGITSKVRVKGKKVTKRYAVRKTNRKGVARFVVKARKPGIIRFRVQGASACSTRVGALGVFQPPVTG